MKLSASCRLPTVHGMFTLHVFEDDDGAECVAALEHRTTPEATVPLVRMHSACFTGDLLGSLRCDCGPQLQTSLALIAEEEYGILLYLIQHEGRGIGLINKLKAYAYQEQGLNTVEANEKLGLPADARDYRAGVDALGLLGVEDCRLATNNPAKLEALEQAGLRVRRVPLGGFVNPHNADYLSAKDQLMGHLGALGDASEETL
jgi:GTP cyclohydrolase II